MIFFIFIDAGQLINEIDRFFGLCAPFPVEMQQSDPLAGPG